MRKLLTILFFLISIKGFTQYPTNQSIGADSTLVTSKGGLKGRLVNWSFSDTTDANLQRIKYYPGAQIFTTTDTLLWFRSPLGNKWIQFFTNSGGSGGDTLVWKLSGNSVATRSVAPVLGTLTSDNLNFITYGVQRMIIPATGIVRNTAAVNKYLLLDTITKNLYYGDGGGSGSTPTWQQTLTAGSILNTSNVIDGDGNDLEFGNNGTFNAYSVNGLNQTRFFNNGTYSQINAGSTSVGNYSDIFVLKDSIKINPNNGVFIIDTLVSQTSNNTLMGWTSTSGANRGKVGSVAIGTGLSLSSGVLSSQGWLTTGNAGTTPGTNFLGTTDSVGLIGKVNNTQAFYIGANGSPTTPWANGSATYFGKNTGVNLGTLSTESVLIGPSIWHYATGTVGASVVIGHGAQPLSIGSSDSSGKRTTIVGYYSNFLDYDGADNATLGAFTMERGSRASNSVAIGRDALRSIRDGSGNVAVGLFGLLQSTTGIRSIAVTNGGSGYTTATVTISAPWGSTSPGICWANATATAVISGGAIVGITITHPGCGYNTSSFTYTSPGAVPVVAGATVTITGDGTGATATASMQSAENNIAIGTAAGYQNRIGRYNTYVGGYLTGGASRAWDDYNSFFGSYADVDAGVAFTTQVSKSTAVGYNAKVSASNTMVLGATGSDQPSVVIGNTSAAASSILDITSTTKGVLLPRLTGAQQAAISSPATGLIVYNTDSLGFTYYNGTAWGKIGSGGGASQWTTTGSDIYYNTGNVGVGTASPGYKFHVMDGANNLLISSLDYFSTVATSGSHNGFVSITPGDGNMAFGYNDGTDNAQVGLFSAGVGTIEMNATKKFYINGDAGIILNESNGANVGIGTTTPAASSILDITSTTKGVLLPRLTGTQQAAISSPATGLMVYNTDSLGFTYYNGTAWSKIGSGGGASSPAGNYGNIQLNRNGAFATPGSDSLDFESATGLSVKGSVNISDGQYLKIGGSNILNYSTGTNNASFAGAYNFLFNNGGNVFFGNTNQTYFSQATGDLYFSSTSSKVGVGTASPNQSVDINGSFGAAITTTTGNLTLDGTHHTVVITGSTPTITLPAAASGNSRRIYVIVNQTGAARTISSYLDFAGASATTVAANSSITIQSNGTSWYRIL